MESQKESPMKLQCPIRGVTHPAETEQLYSFIIQAATRFCQYSNHQAVYKNKKKNIKL